MIVGFGHQKGVGKDKAAKYLVREYGFQPVSFAVKLKDMVRRMFDLKDRQVYGTQEDKETIDPRWGKTPRQLMQDFGESMRQTFGEDIWIRFVAEKIEHLESLQQASREKPHKLHWVVSDVRHINEAEWIRKAPGGCPVEITREAASSENDGHVSEHALVDYTGWSYHVENNLEAEDMYAHLDVIVEAMGGR